MVALPHYPMLCRPFRTHLPRKSARTLKRSATEGKNVFIPFASLGIRSLTVGDEVNQIISLNLSCVRYIIDIGSGLEAN